ncbi:MAG: hypothetical protein IPO81_00250 [Kouleothrix sp.]|nr:hypothetical protein [Kouleothrix sp.]
MLLIRFSAHAKRLSKAQILLLCQAELIPYYQHVGFVHRGASDSTHGGLAWHEMTLQLGELPS